MTTKTKKKTSKKQTARRPDRVLLLRTSNAQHRSWCGFEWPSKVGSVVKPERWSAKASCGDGLHGYLWGRGDHESLSPAEDAVWQVVSCAESDVVPIDGGCKHKAREVILEYVGTRDGAVAYIRERGGALCGPIGTLPGEAVSSTGYRSTTSSTGHCSATSSTGRRSTTSSTGHCSAVSSTGEESIAVCVGSHGRARAGESGAIVLAERDDGGKLVRWVFGAVGHDGINPGVWYAAKDGKLIETDDDVTRDADDRIKATQAIVAKK